MADYHEYCPLTGDELSAMYAIAGQMRQLTLGMTTGRTPIAAEVARRAGARPNGSLRALLAMPDLRRPRSETFEVVATAVGRPDLAATWAAYWGRIEHPAGGR